MEGENVNRGIVVAVAMVSVFIFIALGVVFLGNDGTEQEDLYVYSDRSSWNIHDHSIFRGLTSVQIANKIGQAMDDAVVVEDKDISFYSFQTGTRYTYDNDAKLDLYTKRYEGKNCNYYVNLDINEPEGGGIVYDVHHAINESVLFFERLLKAFDTTLSDNYATEIDSSANEWYGWAIHLKQTFSGNLFTDPGARIVVDHTSGKIINVLVMGWLYTDELKVPGYDWEDVREDLLESLEKINFTTEVPIHAEISSDRHTSWSEFLQLSYEHLKFDHHGYTSTFGRYTIILGMEYWVPGNFSNTCRLYPDMTKYITVWLNGTVHFTQKWYFDTGTGKLLYWSLSGDRGGSTHEFPENLFGSNTTWDGYMLNAYPSFIK